MISKWSHIARFLISAGIMLLTVYSSFAEEKKEKKGIWNGDFSLSAGTNFRTPEKDEVGEVYSRKYTRTSSEGSALVGYKGKKFSLEGRDLLDKAIETYTISDDETEKRLEVDNNNRRAFILGLSYSF